MTYDHFDFTIQTIDSLNWPVPGTLEVNNIKRVVGEDGKVIFRDSQFEQDKTYIMRFSNSNLPRIIEQELKLTADLRSSPVIIRIPRKPISPPITPPSPVIEIAELKLSGYLLAQYYSREAQRSFFQNLERPKSNFESYQQVSAVFYLENLIGSKIHLQTHASLLILNSLNFGFGFSATPTFSVIRKRKFGFNAYSGGFISSHGSNLENKFNGFREVYMGIRLGFGESKSKLDNGKFMIDMQRAFQEIPFVSGGEYKVKSVPAWRFGGELGINRWRIHSLAVLFSIDKVFDSNFSVALKFH
jgi:hypothetical protein